MDILVSFHDVSFQDRVMLVELFIPNLLKMLCLLTTSHCHDLDQRVDVLVLVNLILLHLSHEILICSSRGINDRFSKELPSLGWDLLLLLLLLHHHEAVHSLPCLVAKEH